MMEEGGGGGESSLPIVLLGSFFMTAGVDSATIKLLTKPSCAASSSFTAKDIAIKNF